VAIDRRPVKAERAHPDDLSGGMDMLPESVCACRAAHVCEKWLLHSHGFGAVDAFAVYAIV
jgi:ABC-type nitrate/sulfonate/bicarbonate transport system ATPase subunit